jgi:NADH dehydrogenase
MASRTSKLVTIFGGSGFVGTQVVQLMARQGYRIRVAVRRPDLAGHVKPLGTVGQIQPIQANLRNPASVQRAVEGADIVINLVGILAEGGRQRFRAVHTMGAKNVAEAAKAAGAEALVHMSALGADVDSPSMSQQSKAMGEEEVLKHFPKAVIVRPSIIFGQGDGFFNLFGALARMFPVLPVISGKTKFQPIFVGDVAQAIVKAATGAVKTGKIYELGGSEVETMQELLQRVLVESNRQRPLVPMPLGLAKFKAMFLQLLPKKLLTADQVVALSMDNVVSKDAIKQKRTLAAFGIEPTSMDAVLPTYMWQYRQSGQFEKIEA